MFTLFDKCKRFKQNNYFINAVTTCSVCIIFSKVILGNFRCNKLSLNFLISMSVSFKIICMGWGRTSDYKSNNLVPYLLGTIQLYYSKYCPYFFFPQCLRHLFIAFQLLLSAFVALASISQGSNEWGALPGLTN